MDESSKNGFFRDPQNIIAAGVTLISLCALLVSVVQTKVLQEERELLQENSRVSVWPRLNVSLTKGYNKTDRSLVFFVLNLSNDGVGPAIITDIKVSYKDSVVSDWWHLFEIQEIPDSIEKYVSNANINKRIVKAGETVEVLNLNRNLPLANAVYHQWDSVYMVIYYESIYGDKWKYEVNTGTTVSIEDFEGLPEAVQFGS